MNLFPCEYAVKNLVSFGMLFYRLILLREVIKLSILKDYLSATCKFKIFISNKCSFVVKRVKYLCSPAGTRLLSLTGNNA